MFYLYVSDKSLNSTLVNQYNTIILTNLNLNKKKKITCLSKEWEGRYPRLTQAMGNRVSAVRLESQKERALVLAERAAEMTLWFQLMEELWNRDQKTTKLNKMSHRRLERK